MSRNKRRLIAIAAAIALLAGGTLAAVTAARPSGTRAHAGAHDLHGPLASAAAYLGLAESQLRAELRSGKSLAQIADATSGKSRAGLIEALVNSRKARLDALAASLKARVTAQVERVGGPGSRTGLLAVAARYLGLERARLRAELRSGHTLAQIAAATPGRSEAGLIEALVADRQQVLAAKQAAGVITAEQARARSARLRSRMTKLVQRAHTRPHRAHARPGAPTG